MGTLDDRPLTQLRQTPAGLSHAPPPTPGPPHLPSAPSPLSSIDPASHPAVRSLYVHVPFCVHKCHYCDFYSIVDTQDRMDAFCDRLILELRSLAPHTHALPLHTIFVGGGTPSLLGPHRWTRLLGALADSFDLSLMGSPDRPADPFPPGEFTVECNPESATPDLFHVLAAGRVNRVSLGAQSFQPDHLNTLERRHDPDNVPRALLAARHARITRQSLDLIYAIPGQSIDHWLADLHHA
ncbi:MAG: radical SAM protein, partial [Phycisphaerales bacterium]